MYEYCEHGPSIVKKVNVWVEQDKDFVKDENGDDVVVYGLKTQHWTIEGVGPLPDIAKDAIGEADGPRVVPAVAPKDGWVEFDKGEGVE